jgi:predicted small lipoprotein YifL
MRLISRISLALAILSVTGCGRKTPIAVTPPPAATIPQPPPAAPTTEAAVRKYIQGEYTGAALDFEEYLKLVPSGGERDRAMFYLGIIYASQDWQKAGNHLNQLVMEFPESPLKPPAQLILSLREQATQLSGEVARLTSEAAQLRTEAAELQNNKSQLADQIASLNTKAEQLTLEAARNKETIKELNSQLERLIRSDLQSRPR